MIDAIRRFFISADFYKSLIFIIAALVPILISYFYFNQPQIGFAIALGVFYNAPSNSPGSVKHRTLGMCASIVLTTLVTLIIGSAAVHIWLVLPLLGVLTFFVSYIAVYGFRASLVSLSVLMAIVVSFAHSYIHLSVVDYAFFVFIGGVWYLLVATIANYFNPKMYIEELLSDTMKLTGEYLQTRAELLLENNSRQKLNTQLFTLQAQLTQKHETLREILLTNRQKSGFSNRIRRKFLLFIELVDMLELAVANPVNYDRVDVVFELNRNYLKTVASLIHEMSNHLVYISKVIIRDEKVVVNSDLKKMLEKIRVTIEDYKNEETFNESNEGFFILVNMFEYQTQQVKKIRAIERVLNVLTLNNSIQNKEKTDKRFITPQDYGANKLLVNFSLKSSIFRHALRLSIAMVFGYLLGYIFEVQNSYWILLTLVVIMRPSYGLTKERMKHRIIGTIIGAVVAVILVYLIQDTFVFGILAVLSLVLALALVQLNYRTFAMFITLHIVFMYALYSPDILFAVKFRVIDTMVGGSIAILANLFLFPSWEFMTVTDSILETLSANSIYLKKIEASYDEKQTKLSEYKLSRKRAFLAMGELNAAFQRMTQEPKSKRKYFSEIYDVVVVANTFLATLASLGTFVRTQKNIAISDKVAVFVENIVDNLTNGKQVLLNEEVTVLHEQHEIEEARVSIEKRYDTLVKRYDKVLLKSENTEQDLGSVSKEIRQTQLILDQLSYLYTLSESLIQKIKIYNKVSK
ncbi:FUSC family protein [Flavicella marina]|uniref:FUSC family protein n=1 Tax=Flavicella marina TaxID=1475951 RepID=UPI00126454EA|nr:FUSC family membrane protein [Flavicella marina]